MMFRKGYIDNRNMNLPFLLGLYGITVSYNEIYKCLYEYRIFSYYHRIYEKAIHSDHGYYTWRDGLEKEVSWSVKNRYFYSVFVVNTRGKWYNINGYRRSMEQLIFRGW